MNRVRILACATLALAASAPATAVAKPKAKPATFRLEIDGSQVTTWNYIKQQEPTCDFPEMASGTQHIEFGTFRQGETAKPKVKIKRAPGDTVAFDFARDDITMFAEARVKRTDDALYSQISPCEPGQGPFGGDDPPADYHGDVDCATVGELDLALGTAAEDVESPSYPTGLPEAKPPKSPLYFAGLPYWTTSVADHSLPVRCAEDGYEGADIGIVESQGEWPGGIIAAGSSLSAKKLLGSKKKRTKVEFARVVKYPNEIQTYGGPPSTTGRTTMDATFTFTRVGK